MNSDLHGRIARDEWLHRAPSPARDATSAAAAGGAVPRRRIRELLRDFASLTKRVIPRARPPAGGRAAARAGQPVAESRNPRMPEVTVERFRSVFSHLATAVLVMTTHTDEVGPHGMTVNAVTSVSLEPILVLVCVQRGTAMEQLIATSATFALSVLPAGSSDVSAHFADHSRPAGAAQFAGVGTRTMTTGAPVLDSCIAWVDCEVWATYDGGDHLIVVGEVVDLGLGVDDATPLVYYRSTYHSVGHGEDAT